MTISNFSCSDSVTGVTVQKQISSKLLLLQYTQQCIPIIKGYFFIQMKQNDFLLADTQSREKFPTITGSGTCSLCGFCLFSDRELCVRVSSSSVRVHAGV